MFRFIRVNVSRDGLRDPSIVFDSEIINPRIRDERFSSLRSPEGHTEVSFDLW